MKPNQGSRWPCRFRDTVVLRAPQFSVALPSRFSVVAGHSGVMSTACHKSMLPHLITLSPSNLPAVYLNPCSHDQLQGSVL